MFGRSLVLALALLLSGCAVIGSTVNSPAPVGQQPRFIGSIALNKVHEEVFRVTALPDGRHLVLGIQLPPGDCQVLTSAMRVSIMMTEEHGRTVIDEDHALREFHWSKGRDECRPALGYLRGKGTTSIPDKNGDVCNQPVITGADGGYGTYFHGRPNGTYNVKVRVYGRPDDRLGAEVADVIIADDGPFAPKICR